jgi:broad specificity phosphatase PhoE
MALGVYFAVQGMTAEKFAAVHEQLAAIGQANPPGRTFHAGFHVGNGIHVFDVWESQESFDEFGKTLMPILEELEVEMPDPVVAEAHNNVTG